MGGWRRHSLITLHKYGPKALIGLRFMMVESNDKYVSSSHAPKVTAYDYIIIAPVYIIIAHIDSSSLNVIFLKFGKQIAARACLAL